MNIIEIIDKETISLRIMWKSVEKEKARYVYEGSPFEFGHSLTEQIGELLKAGFVLEDLYEDNWGGEDPIDKHMNAFIAIKARKQISK